MITSLFCVIEGMDGVGKSTLIQNLKSKLKDNQLRNKFIFLQEPTTLASGKNIRKLLRQKNDLSIHDWLNLFIDDREKNFLENIKPALAANKIIIQDRYFYSTAAYQGKTNADDNYTPEKIIKLNQQKGFPEPDILFYLELSPEEALERIKKARKHIEIFETLSHLKKIYINYKRLLPSSAIILDAQKPQEDLCKEVFEKIRTRIPNFF